MLNTNSNFLARINRTLTRSVRSSKHIDGNNILGRSSRACRAPLSSVVTTTSSHKVGFIGLGNMGYSMAKNLCKDSKYVVLAYDTDSKKSQSLAAECQGRIFQVDSLSEIAKNCKVIITMLPATKHVNGVLLGGADGNNKSGVLSEVQKGTLLIDCSTIDPLASQALHKAAASLYTEDSDDSSRVMMIDAPVSGGVTGAAAGTLTFMVGGNAQAVDAAKPILSMMGKNIVHCGGAGTGGITKLCNNLSLAISMVGTSEAMSLGVKLGMDPKTLANVMNTSTARCWSSDTYNPVPGVIENIPSSRNYSGGFGVALMEKDLGLAVELAQKIRARTPLGANAHQLYGMLSDHGYAEKDFSVVYKFLSSMDTDNANKTH